MKKVLSFVLAVVMVLSLSTVAFAAAASNNTWDVTGVTEVSGKPGQYVFDAELVMAYATAGSIDLEKSFTLAAPLTMVGNNGEGEKVTLNIDTGASKADDFSLTARVKKGADVVKVKADAAGKKVEIQAIPDWSWGLNKSASFEVIVAMHATGKGARNYDDAEVTIKGTVVLKGSSDLTASNTGESAVTAPSEMASGNVYKIANTKEDVEYTFAGLNDIYLVFSKMYDSSAFTLVYNDIVPKAVQKSNLDADITMYNFLSAPEFDYAAKLIIEADEDAFVYEYVDGKVVPTKLVWDEEEYAWVLKTNVLGAYIVSDKELPVSEASAEVANPSTGAADMVNVAVAMAVVSIAAAGAVALKK